MSPGRQGASPRRYVNGLGYAGRGQRTIGERGRVEWQPAARRSRCITPRYLLAIEIRYETVFVLHLKRHLREGRGPRQLERRARVNGGIDAAHRRADIRADELAGRAGLRYKILVQEVSLNSTALGG